MDKALKGDYLSMKQIGGGSAMGYACQLKMLVVVLQVNKTGPIKLIHIYEFFVIVFFLYFRPIEDGVSSSNDSADFLGILSMLL